MKPDTSPRPPLLISYLRFSRMEQLRGDSTRRQLDLSERYAETRGWKIDKSISDKGISAFRGANATSGALSKLLELVKAKRIPKGSVLLVESLDRLSRNQIAEALELFMGLVRAGIRIVTLGDGFEYSAEHLDLSNLMYSLMVMSRAHEESATKSKRLAEAWKEKRAQIAEKPLTKLLPAWLAIADGKINVVDEKAQVVRRIFDLALHGHGITAILKRLNEERIVIGPRRDYWQRSYVAKILHSRAVLGEFQPHKITYRDGKRHREPVGDPIVGYYPAIISEQTFYATQAALKARLTHTGPNSLFLNLFKGLLFDAGDGSPLQVQTKTTRAYASAAAINGQPGHSPYVAFPTAAFEAAFLSRISETCNLNLDDRRTDDLAQKLASISGKVQATTKRIDEIHAALTDAGENANPSALVPALAKLDETRKRLVEEQEHLQEQLNVARMGSPAEAAEHIASLMVGSVTGLSTREARLELQQAIRQLVERLDCRTSREGMTTRCAVTVTLRNSSTLTYTAVVHNRVPNEVLVIGDDEEDKTYITVERVDETSESESPRSGVSLQTADRVRQMWSESIRPMEIAKECGISVSQVYRIAGKLPRQKKWKPASRWGGSGVANKRPTRPGQATARSSGSRPRV